MSSDWDPYTVSIVLLDWIKGTQCQNKWCQQTHRQKHPNHPKHPGRLWPFHPVPPLLALDCSFPLLEDDLQATHWRPAIQRHATTTASWGGCRQCSLPKISSKKVSTNTYWQWWEVLLDGLCIWIIARKGCSLLFSGTSTCNLPHQIISWIQELSSIPYKLLCGKTTSPSPNFV